MQTGMCPLWFAAGIARPKHGLALATGLQAAPMLCHWVLGVPAARQGLMGLSLSFPTQAEGKAVLITGCDKGFGHALAKQLHAKGFTVFAGCLLADKNGDGARELKAMKSDRMQVLQMDVCSDQEVAQAVDFVKRTLKEPEGVYGCVVLCFNKFMKYGLNHTSICHWDSCSNLFKGSSPQ